MDAPTLLVPLDVDGPSCAALPVAKALAEITGAHVHVLHVSRDPTLPLASLAARLGLAGAALPGWSIEASAGDPGTAIVEVARARQAALVVLCRHTAATTPQGILGRTALQVLREAPCPVVLVPPGGDLQGWRPKRVLLPFDGSPAANAAVVPAAALALQADVDLVVVDVGAPAAMAPSERGSLGMPRYLDQPQHEWPQWARELLGRLASQCPDAPRLRLHVRCGDPAAEILRAAGDPDALVVLAWKGDWSRTRAATLKAVLRGATCPVMVVHAPASA